MRPSSPLPSAAIATSRLGSYRDPATGCQREIVCIAAGEARLLVDRVFGTRDDARLVARVERDEPTGNLGLLARMYLDDATRGKCGLVQPEDLGPRVGGAGSGHGPQGGGSVELGEGRTAAIAQVASEEALRWTIAAPATGAVAVCLRDVVAELQNYEPVLAMTSAVLHGNGTSKAGADTRRLAGEYARLVESPIVLNRGLRERVLRALVQEGCSMSEIAIRCGRFKRDRLGRETGETSWLGRRIGLLPEAGKTVPTRWVHSKVLALIARDGLGVAPREVELR